MKKLDYEFWKDLTSVLSYVLFAISILGEKFLPSMIVGVASASCIVIIMYCAF